MCRGTEEVKQHQPLFVPGHFTKVSVVVMMAFERRIIKGFFYSVGSVKRQSQSRTVNYLQDIIQALKMKVTSSLLLLILKLHLFITDWVM